MSVKAQTTVSIVPSSTSATSSSRVSTGRVYAAAEGRLRTPLRRLRESLRAREAGVHRECELALALHPGELLLGPHPDRALEPLPGRDDPPAAEEQADPDEPEDRVVRQRP